MFYNLKSPHTTAVAVNCCRTHFNAHWRQSRDYSIEFNATAAVCGDTLYLMVGKIYYYLLVYKFKYLLQDKYNIFMDLIRTSLL